MGKDWKNRAITETIAKNVCSEYRGLMERCDSIEEIFDLYKRGVDWSLENDAPSLSLLREYKDECEKNGIFMDRHFDGEVLDSQQTYIFHNCSGTIKTGLNIEKRIIPMLYFANGCDMTVEASGNFCMKTRVPLYIYGDNKIMAEQSGDIECILYKRVKKC